MGKIQGVHHISLNTQGVEEFNKAIIFYTEVLGMKVIRTWGEGENLGAMVDTGNCCLELGSNAKEDKGDGNIAHLALRCEDVAGVLAEVEKAGYPVTLTAREFTFKNSTPPCTACIGFFIGPCREKVELFNE